MTYQSHILQDLQIGVFKGFEGERGGSDIGHVEYNVLGTTGLEAVAAPNSHKPLALQDIVTFGEIGFGDGAGQRSNDRELCSLEPKHGTERFKLIMVFW